MANNTETVPYNFDELYAEAQRLFANKGFDTAEGSNTSQLAAVEAYLISSLNTNTAININETLLPYATKRKNILQDARVLGYEAQHITSYQYKVTIRLSYDLIGYGTIILPKYSVFTNSNNTYIFIINSSSEEITKNGISIDTGNFKVNDTIYAPKDLTFEYDTNTGYIKTAKTSDGAYVTNLQEIHQTFISNRDFYITVKEGELTDFNMDPSALEQTIGSVTVNGSTYTRNYIDIPYTNVENDGIDVYVSYYDDYGNYQEKIPYTKTNDYFFEKDSNNTGAVKHKFLRIDDIEMGTPRIYFKYAGLGEGVPFGSLVQICIIQSKGTDGELSDITYNKFVFSKPNYSLMYDRAQTTEESDAADKLEPETEELNVFSGLKFPSVSSGTEGTKYYVENIFDDAKIIGIDLLCSGANEESSNSIVLNAPKVYNSANRLVTNLDYKYACNRSAYVLDSCVWGGEDEYPKAPGHIWFSFLPNKVSERGFTSDSNNTEYQRNNSSLVYNYAEGESIYQHQLRQEYYNRNYILNTEIKSYSAYVNENGVVVRKYSGVWGDLMNKYVPSLTFHHRHPIYCNFNYVFEILKYNLKETTQDVHAILFDDLDKCFYGGESLDLENYEVEYFHTNIVKRLDYLLSDLCGFNSSLTLQLILNEKTLCTENWKSEYKDIYIPLCVPFEKYFSDDGYLDTDRLPNIDTENFINFTYDIIRDPLGVYGKYDVTADSDSTTDDENSSTYTSYDGLYINKYTGETGLRYSVVSADIFTDWTAIKENSKKNKELELQNKDSKDYSDISAKIFVAPVKVKMKYRYLITQDFIDAYNSNQIVDIQLGFRLAPDNTKDESYNGIQATLYKSADDNTVIYSKEQLKPVLQYNYDDPTKLRMRTNLHLQYVLDSKGLPVMSQSNLNNVLEVEFTRTCGYYYLFNTFKKEVLIHLFVNGDYEGFSTAKIGMRTNRYYDTHLEELAAVFKENETKFYDSSCYVDVTYSNPSSYLYTSDKKYLTTDEQAEDSMKYDVFGHEVTETTKLTSLDYYPINGKTENRYLTTEGYLIDTEKDISDVDYYTGEAVRDYRESMYLYTPLTMDMFRQNVYLDLKYPSLNFKFLRNVIPRLNNVKFKNATEQY